VVSIEGAYVVEDTGRPSRTDHLLFLAAVVLVVVMVVTVAMPFLSRFHDRRLLQLNGCVWLHGGTL